MQENLTNLLLEFNDEKTVSYICKIYFAQFFYISSEMNKLNESTVDEDAFFL